MLRRAELLVIGVLLARAHAVGAQEAEEPRVPTIDAGDVATIVLQVPAAADNDSASYTLELGDGFRAFVPLTGRVDRLDDRFLLPVTFATPDRLPAGRVVAGRVAVEVEGREPVRRELAVYVRERREVSFELDVDEMTVAPDGVAGVTYRARNLGSLPDTLYVEVRAGEGWALLGAPRLVLAPGDSALGVLRIAAPVTVSPGDRELLLVNARTVAGEQSRTLDAVIVSPAGWLGDLAQVPGSVFIGQALEAGQGPVVAVSGGGEIGPDTDVRIELRHSDPDLVDPALQRQVAGARFRASLTRPGLEIEAGDVYGTETTLSGSLRQARGVRSTWDPRGPLTFHAVAAMPTGFGGELDGGHILYGETGLETAYGQFDVLAGDMRYPARGTIAEMRTTGAGLRWGGHLGPHEGSVETSFVRFVAADSLVRSGPALDLRYRLAADGTNGRLRLRRVPGAGTGPGGQGNELSGSLSTELAPRVYLVGWGYRTDQTLLGIGAATRSYAGNLGVRTRVGRFQMQLGGTLSDRRTVTAVDSFTFARNTVRAEATYTRGALSIQTDARIGTSAELDRTGPYRSFGSSVRWYGHERWGWLRVQYSTRPGGIQSTDVHAGGAVGFGPVHVSGGLSTSFIEATNVTSFWSSTEIRVQRSLAVHLGASARPSLDRPDWTFSIGVSRRLNLPLPVPRRPDLHGVVFDDADNDGVRDPDEPGVADVAVALGHLETVTDGEGRFAFRDRTGSRLRLRPGTLPIGYVPSPRAVLPTRGEASIPLLRVAALQLQLFLDRDEDGERDNAEGPAEGAIVSVTDEHGRQRTATADSTGTVHITGLFPGSYAITARPASAPAPDQEPEVLMEIELEPGSAAHHTLPVPLRRRTIRMDGGEGGGFRFFEGG